jgi:hypothetical protein
LSAANPQLPENVMKSCRLLFSSLMESISRKTFRSNLFGLTNEIITEKERREKRDD